jgi:hypothetical protein
LFGLNSQPHSFRFGLFVCLLGALWGLLGQTSCVFGNLKPETNKFDASVPSSSGKIKCFIISLFYSLAGEEVPLLKPYEFWKKLAR